MRASLCVLWASVALCVAHAAALAQPPGGANPSYSPFDPSSPGGVRNPFDPPSSGEWQSRFGSYRPVPTEPRAGSFPDQQDANPNPGAAAPIPPELISQLINPPKIDLNFQPAPLPVAGIPRQEPLAAPPWQGWEWVVAGIGVLCLLARIQRDRNARKHPADGGAQCRSN
jgi:hypothetical protein